MSYRDREKLFFAVSLLSYLPQPMRPYGGTKALHNLDSSYPLAMFQTKYITFGLACFKRK